MNENKNIRIKDIAKMAGVSVGTVDRVIHKRGKVSDDARKKVEEILEQTGYQPNLIARTLGSNRTLKIAVLIPDPQHDEYWAFSNDGINNASEEWSQYGLEILTFHFDQYNNNSFEAATKLALEAIPDSFLIAPIFYRESLDLFKTLKEKEIPYVLFNSSIPEAEPISFIGQDLYQSGRVAGELLDVACKDAIKKIGVLHVYEDVANSVHLRSKEDGLRDYFKTSETNTEIIDVDLSHPNDPEFEDQIIKLIDNHQLTGILVSTSKGTHLTARALKNNGRNDVKIVGYDLLKKNIELLKDGNISFLINQNPKRQALIGISHLANHILFRKEPPSKDLFPLEIITKQNLDSYIASRIH